MKGVLVMKTAQEYVASLKDLRLKVFMFGERIENPVEHPIICPQ